MSDLAITVMEEIRAIDQARLAVKPFVGDLPMACDSADSVYLQALKSLGHDTRELRSHPGTATAIWPALKRLPPKNGHIAMDKKAASRREEMFPHAKRLGHAF